MKKYDRELLNAEADFIASIPEFARKVYPIYELLEWEWQEPITIKGIADMLFSLYVSCKNNKCAESGGLRVEKEDGYFEMKMVITL